MIPRPTIVSSAAVKLALPSASQDRLELDDPLLT